MDFNFKTTIYYNKTDKSGERLWLYKFEVIHIVEGSMKLQILSEIFTIHAEEIAVINANALHCASGDPYCKLQSLVFSPLLITGNVNSPLLLFFLFCFIYPLQLLQEILTKK